MMQTILLCFYSHKWPLHVTDIYLQEFLYTGCFTCKCPKHVEAIYENKIIVKLFVSSWYISLLKHFWSLGAINYFVADIHY